MTIISRRRPFFEEPNLGQPSFPGEEAPPDNDEGSVLRDQRLHDAEGKAWVRCGKCDQTRNVFSTYTGEGAWRCFFCHHWFCYRCGLEHFRPDKPHDAGERQ